MSEAPATVTVSSSNDGGVMAAMGYKRGKPMSTFERLKRGPALWQLFRGDRVASSDIILPERYLEACFELFLFTMILAWVVTSVSNPGMISRNRLKDIVGYNNVCVGFDEPPARYVVAPLMVLMAYLAIRYVTLDSLRADLEKAQGKINCLAYRFTQFANTFFVLVSCVWPMLLIITPDVSITGHFTIFIVFVVACYLCVGANFFESPKVSAKSKIWFTYFTLQTFGLAVVGAIDFNTYDYQQCPSANASVLPRELCEQDPLIAWQLLAYLDWGWFVLLGMTIVFLPDSPPIASIYVLVESHGRAHTSLDDVARSISDQVHKMLASGELRKVVEKEQRIAAKHVVVDPQSVEVVPASTVPAGTEVP